VYYEIRELLGYYNFTEVPDPTDLLFEKNALIDKLINLKHNNFEISLERPDVQKIPV